MSQTTLAQLLGDFPGTTDEILKYKSAIVQTIYTLVRPNFVELTAGVRGVSPMYGIDIADPKFNRNIVYCMAVLRTEKIIKRVPLHDEDIYLIEDSIRPTLDQILDPAHSIELLRGSDVNADSTSLNQSILLEAPTPPPQAPPQQCVVV